MSTRRGVLCLRSCTINHGLSTQKATGLPSAGAETYVATRAISDADGLKPIGQYFGETHMTVAWVDAQAFFGISCRSGLGKTRHIETAGLWILD